MAELSLQELPIDILLPELRQILMQQCNAVLQAAPGAGKTTRVPLALLDAPWLQHRKIIMLEPRRLAARAAARYMAASLGERVGETVGYRVRLDNRVGPATRVEVVTEGILARMLQQDPSLEAAGLVIFDEFHERSLAGDLGLALCLDSQSALREDLRLLLMSATLDGDAVAQLLGDAPLLSSAGRSFPVTQHYRPVRVHFARERRAFCHEVARQVLAAVRDEEGSILVFLPGAGEIRLVQSLLQAASLDDSVLLAPLYGQLPARAQDAAIQPVAAGGRKIVLATTIAETSLTIEGIRVVIDAGLTRQLRFDPNTGLSQLVTVPVSQASAEQVLELSQWGVHDVTQLRWLDEPPAAHLAQATALLQQLGALDTAARSTRHGSDMLRFGTHPRLAHMMLKGQSLGAGALACELAALLGERDPMTASGGRDTDITLRVELLRGIGRTTAANAGLLKQIRATAAQWQRQLRCAPYPPDHSDISMAGVLLAFAYPDRIARRRAGSDNRFIMSNGRGALFFEAEPLAAEDMIVAAHLDGSREARIFLAARVQAEQLRDTHAALLTTVTHVEWDEREGCVQARRQVRIGEVVLDDEPWKEADPQAVAQALLKGIRRQGVAVLPWNAASRELQARLSFMQGLEPQSWPDVSDDALLATLESWLLPYITGLSRLLHLKRLDLPAILLARLDWLARQRLDEQAPTHLQVPSGSRVRLDYSQATPVLAVRLQEMFGLTETPCIAAGRVPVLLHLLSPARRPVQVTQDLAAFWQGSYHDVRKELKGRYPKHHWPDDPQLARATTRTRRKPAN